MSPQIPNTFASSSIKRPVLATIATVIVLTGACSTDDELAEPRPTVPVVTTTTSTNSTTTTDAQGADATPKSDTAQPTDPTDPPNTEESTATTSPPPITEPAQDTRPDGNLFNANIALEQVINLNEPIDMAIVSGDDLAWIAERGGRVLRVDLTHGEVVETVLDISTETIPQGEQGLLGIEVSANWLYVNFTDLNGDTRVDAFRREGTGLSGERRTILTQTQPFRNHNGGDLATGPDGYLYIAFGDGGSANDPFDYGQNPEVWHGSILRIKPTPTATKPYSIPADNPYASPTSTQNGTQDTTPIGAPEVFITGVRNPWRISFDRQTGDLWIADVGQDRYEEVTVLLAANRGGAGANLGWRLREGLHEFAGDKPPGHVDPVWEYGHDQGCSVTGGFVYRGSAIAELAGSYVFGDYCTARLWAVQISSGEVLYRDFGVAVPGGSLTSFGQDANGELYTLSLDGPVSRLIQR